ncbi:MAG: hypothetical protein SWO11_15755 [Thermodesulfobacteriota bacterium]|nr:hypothetical protein [Thermodesulfobacteriota bacterium]
MKITYVLLISVFILALNGYGESRANDINAFFKACGSSYNLGDPICKCLAKKADERLTPLGFAFLVASMNNDDEKTAKLRSKLGMSEAMDAGMFMVNTTKECAEEIDGN